ncbi:uncharacterized protein B0P05DRAFT_560654, partial [Gilbertella persicaria]|uniref:uncharacterized protein n=1 Tax=Gilbertella persicaria TaxID=101096 RepID=UPI00221F61B9
MTDFYQHDNDQFSYHHFLPDQEQRKRRLSFSTLLHRPSLIGRKISMFRKKPELTVMIPHNLQRSMTNSSTESELKTPTSMTEETVLSSRHYDGQQGYSNFYIKLPNGNWMVRVRDSNRKIIDTYEIDGAM